jgi:Flp pilus assembly pilin Flp
LTWWRDGGSQPDEPVEQLPEALPEPLQHRERGQSIVEYAILLVWLTLAFIGLIRAVGGATKGVWSTANSSLVQANTTGHGQ